jgi:hypothetical protein
MPFVRIRHVARLRLTQEKHEKFDKHLMKNELQFTDCS